MSDEIDYKAEYEKLKAQSEQYDKIYADLRADIAKAQSERDTAIKQRDEANELYLNSGIKKDKEEKNKLWGDLK